MCVFAAFAIAPHAKAAEPYTPSDAEAVLYEMPLALRQQRDAVAAARRAWAADPADPQIAHTVAEADLRLGEQTGDPRFFGYARAALAPWWGDDAAPAPILALRAELKENDHDYAGAIADFELFVQQRPRDEEAYVELANLHRVRGDYAAGEAAAQRLAEFAPPVSVALARVPLLAVTGRLDAADAQLALVRPQVEREHPDAIPWLLVTQAQFARARGDQAQAETYYRQALSDGLATDYLRRSYADLLLLQERYDEVLTLTEGRTYDTGQLLRAAIAAKQSGDRERAAQWTDEIGRRFDEIRLRGGVPHGRFEARYLLELKDDPEQALAVALENWVRQREQLDARHALAAALAARQPDAAEPVLAFLREHSTQDAELQALIDQLESSP